MEEKVHGREELAEELIKKRRVEFSDVEKSESFKGLLRKDDGTIGFGLTQIGIGIYLSVANPSFIPLTLMLMATGAATFSYGVFKSQKR
ncbi:MAG: hypothetical protein ACP5GB_01035 [Candidatus Micrarchaeia archaeon]